ncbi:hypothetical protein LINPERHAP2_LOCUS18661, partial [Linum perenne]
EIAGGIFCSRACVCATFLFASVECLSFNDVDRNGTVFINSKLPTVQSSSLAISR